MKFVNAKNVRQYIDDENIQASWGGKDNYAYSFKPENRPSDENVFVNGTLQNNNNDAEQANLNLLNKKASLR